MTPVEILAIINTVNAGIGLLEILIPKLQAALNSGELNAEQQAELLAKFNGLKDNLSTKFAQDHWRLGVEPPVETILAPVVPNE